MPAPAIAAIATFVLLFIGWVVLPSRLRKHHENKLGKEIEPDE